MIIALILVRKFFHLDFFLRNEHFNGMAHVLADALADLGLLLLQRLPGALVRAGAGRQGHPQDARTGDPTAPFWYAMLFCNTIVPPLVLWSKKMRTSLPILFIVSVLVNVGMYLERVIIIPITLARNELPYSWGCIPCSCRRR